MMTEIMGFLILAGAIIVFLVRWQSRKESRPVEEHQDMQYATQQLRQELERTGSEITSRMEQHVMQLEQLIHEADHRKSILEGRIVELRELVKLGEEQMDALHTLRSEIVEARQLRQQLADARNQVAADVRGIQAAAPVRENLDFSDVLNQSMQQDSPQPVYQTYNVQPEPVPYNSRSTVPLVTLNGGIQYEYEEAEEPVQTTVPAENNVVKAPASEVLQDEQASTDSAKARALLMNGWSVEDVSRETGLGKGAVELMKEMMRRQAMG